MTDEIVHHGVIGMKWGVRRYQNYDGSYTKKGAERYKQDSSKETESSRSAKKVRSNRSGSGVGVMVRNAAAMAIGGIMVQNAFINSGHEKLAKATEAITVGAMAVNLALGVKTIEDNKKK